MGPPGDFDLKTERQKSQVRLKKAILAEATRLLVEGGPEGLSVRNLAKAVGASTKVIYSHFGGMQGVVSAVYEDGFARLTAALQAADDLNQRPQTRLAAVAQAYRGFAIRYPDLFDLMYGPNAKWLAPTTEDRLPAAPSLEIVMKIILSGQVTHHLKPGDAMEMAYQFWATMHGPVALEATRWLDQSPERTFRKVVDAAIAALTAVHPVTRT